MPIANRRKDGPPRCFDRPGANICGRILDRRRSLHGASDCGWPRPHGRWPAARDRCRSWSPAFRQRHSKTLKCRSALSPRKCSRRSDAYFESLVMSRRYAALGYRGWSLVDGFRAAALSYSVALWLFRWASGSELRADEMIPIVACLDRSQAYAPLTGRRHRRRVATLAQEGQLQRLAVWYAR